MLDALRMAALRSAVCRVMGCSVTAAFLLCCALPALAQSPRSFLYQLQNLDVAQAAASPFDLIVTDYSLDGTAAGKLTPADVSALRAGGGRTVLAYLSIGEAEDYRYYWQAGWVPGSPSWLGPDNPAWPGNYKTRYWDPAWQGIIFGSPEAYLDQIIAQGFDGAYLDIIDAFEFWGPDGNNERPSAAQDMVDFVKALAEYARVTKGKPDFQVFPQNAPQLAGVDSTYVATVSGIGAEDTWTVGNRSQRAYHTDYVTAWLDLFRDAGKTVLAIHWWVTVHDAAGAQRSSRSRRLVRLHEGISTTIFWIGEPASAENGFIANDDSAWDECWKERYGGIDDPDSRNGYHPAGFTPSENPFYFALPYNDLNDNGDRKWNVPGIVPWAKTVTFPPSDSAVKNRWAKIINGATTCYGQWEDVGPFNENDWRYVFRGSRPQNRVNQRAGLDVSPALRDCLGLVDGISATSWRFVDAVEVPPGPWTDIVTTSQLNFNPATCP